MRFLLTATGGGLCIGLLAPLIWLVAWRNGHYVGDESGVLDRLVPFFPFSVINLAAPYPPDRFWTAAIFALSALLNAALYGSIVAMACGLLAVVQNWRRNKTARSARQ